jgi:hypothetical protein
VDRFYQVIHVQSALYTSVRHLVEEYAEM